MCGLLFLLILVNYSLAKLSCSGCNDPIEALSVWTDDSSIWRCEKIQRHFVDTCQDEAEILCSRKERLGGSLYIMTFPQSPEVEGIKPDHVRKSNGSQTSIAMTCKNGGWKIRNKNRTQEYILCDQFITEDKRPDTSSSTINGSLNVSTTTSGISAISYVTTGKPLITEEMGYDFIHAAPAAMAKHPLRKAKAGKKSQQNKRGSLRRRALRLRKKQKTRKIMINKVSKKRTLRIA